MNEFICIDSAIQRAECETRDAFREYARGLKSMANVAPTLFYEDLSYAWELKGIIDRYASKVQALADRF